MDTVKIVVDNPNPGIVEAAYFIGRRLNCEVHTEVWHDPLRLCIRVPVMNEAAYRVMLKKAIAGSD